MHVGKKLLTGDIPKKLGFRTFLCSNFGASFFLIRCCMFPLLSGIKRNMFLTL